MKNAKIKKEFADRHIAFGNNTAPLGKLSQEQLNELALIAHQSGRQDYKDLFDELPSAAELQGKHVEQAIDAAKLVDNQGPVGIQETALVTSETLAEDKTAKPGIKPGK